MIYYDNAHFNFKFDNTLINDYHKLYFSKHNNLQ